MDVTIYRETIPSTDPRLRRHIHHDSRARRYPFDTSGLSIQSVEHERAMPILDQGQVGSCTAETGFGILGTEPYYTDQIHEAAAAAFGSFDQAGAYRLYSAEESRDGSGGYPPTDVGSSGLTLAKVLRAAGLIAGWEQTFSLDDALKALMLYPLAVGTYWYNSMFTPDAEGIVRPAPSSGIAGGHEYEAVGYDKQRDLVKFANSWGAGWGQAGYFYMDAEEFGTLLDRQGDVTVFTPATQPAPVPTPIPPDDADVRLAAEANQWVTHRHTGASHLMQAALLDWLREKGLRS